MELEELCNKETITKKDCINNGLKLYFPYSTAQDYNSLKNNFEPFKPEEFISTITNKNLLSPEYEKYQNLINHFDEKTVLSLLCLKKVPTSPLTMVSYLNKIMQTLNLDRADFLELYVATDTVSTLKLLSKMVEEFRAMGIHSFHDCCTLSGMSFLHMHKSDRGTGLDSNFYVNLDEDVYKFIQRGLVGGVSSSLNRLAIKGHTKIRPHQYGLAARTVGSIKIFDLNSLYTNVIGDDLSCTIGFPILREKETNYKVTTCNGKWPIEYEALMYISEKEFPNKYMKSFMSPMGQHILNLPSLGTYTPLDGYVPAEQTAISFHGCLYHGCARCYKDINWDMEHPVIKGKSWREVRERSEMIDREIKKNVRWHLIIWECDFKKINYSSNSHFIQRLKDTKEYTEEEIIEEIQKENINGFVEADIHITEKACKEFIDFPPPFVKDEVQTSQLDAM